MTLECLRQFPNVQVTAMDFSEEMLKAGTHKIQEQRQSGQVQVLCGDALDMPFEESGFDVVFCAYGVRNFSDTSRGISEIRRVLKPNGQILILDFFKAKHFLSRIFHKTYAEHVLPRVGAWISGHPEAYSYLRDSIRGFITTDEMCKMLQNLGFKETRVTDFFGGVSSCVQAR